MERSNPRAIVRQKYAATGKALVEKLAIVAATAILTIAIYASTRDPNHTEITTTVSARLIVADFNGDGLLDTLQIPLNSNLGPGIIFSEIIQRPDPARGISWPVSRNDQVWSDADFYPVVADFNGDGRFDLLMQTPNETPSVLFHAGLSGLLEASSERVSSAHFQANWSSAVSRITPGDFNGDGRSDLILSPWSTSSEVVVGWTGETGMLTEETNGFRFDVDAHGLDWLADSSELLIGNFNGQDSDGGYRQDVLVRYVKDADSGTHGVVVSDTQGRPIKLADSWSSSDSDAPWADADFNVAVIDIDGNGQDDLLFHPKYERGDGFLVSPDVEGGFSGQPVTQISAEEVERLLNQGGNQHLWGSIRESSTTTRLESQSLASIQSGSRTESSTRMPTLPTVNAVGQVSGQHSVNFGVASYQIPIVVPPGRKGVQPDLSFSYSHQSKDSVMGRGWGVSGLSSISRCSADPARDGSAYSSSSLGGVSFTTKDRLCMDGQRLMAQGGSYWQASTHYRTEIDTFADVRAITGTANQIEGFEVRTASNLILTYGGTEGSIIRRAGNTGTASEPVLEWKLSRVSDYNNNHVEYLYTSVDENSKRAGLLIDEIRYTLKESTPGGALTAGDQDVRLIKFTYATAGRPDPITHYVAGTRLEMRDRLEKVETKLAGDTIRTYELFYAEEGAGENGSYVSRLEHIFECAFDHSVTPASKKCLPGTKFEWTNASVDRTSGSFSLLTSETSGLSKESMLVDITGDGQLDIVEFTGSTNTQTDVSIWEMGHNGEYSKSDYNLDSLISYQDLRRRSYQLDYNRDGKTDFLVPISDFPTQQNPVVVPALYEWENGQLDDELRVINVPIRWEYLGPDPDRWEFEMQPPSENAAPVTLESNTSGYLREVELGWNFTSQTITNANLGSYEFYIRACNGSICSDWSNPMDVPIICTSDPDCPFIEGPSSSIPIEASNAPLLSSIETPPSQRAQICGNPANTGSTLAIVSFEDSGASNEATVLDTGIPTTRLLGPSDIPDVNWSGESFYVLDVNGDGLEDIVTRDYENWWLYERVEGGAEQEDTFQRSTTWCPSVDGHASAYVIEYDGDGRADLLVHRNFADPIIYKSTGDSFAEVSNPGLTYTPARQYELNQYDTYRIEAASPPVVADFNGDGLTDVLYSRAVSGQGGYNIIAEPMVFYFNTGGQFVASTSILTPVSIDGNQQLASYLVPFDYDGDGDLDLLRPHDDSATTDGYGPCYQFTNANEDCEIPGIVSEYDGYFWDVEVFEKDNFVRQETSVVKSTLGGLKVLDIASDGSQDLIGVDFGEDDHQIPDELWPTISKQKSGAQYLLQRVTKGEDYFDHIVEFEYAPLVIGNGTYSSNTVAQDLNAVGMTGSGQFVKRVSVTNGVTAQLNATSFEYDTAVYDTEGRGFVGFKSIRVNDEARGLSNLTTYHQEFPRIGLPIKSETMVIGANGTYASPHEVTSYEGISQIEGGAATPYKVLNSNGSYFAYPEVVSTVQYAPENPATKLSRVDRKITGVTNYGAITSSITTTYAFESDAWTLLRERTETNTYFSHDVTNWWVNKLNTNSVTALVKQDAAGLSNRAVWVASDNAFQHSLNRKIGFKYEGAGTSREVTTIERNKNSNVYKSTLTLGRTAHGLIESTTLTSPFASTNLRFFPERKSVVGYDSQQDYFPRSIGHGSDEDIYRETGLSVDSFTGQLRWAQDPNLSGTNRSIIRSYDAFGRPVNSNRASAAPVSIDYTWLAEDNAARPCPTTGGASVYRVVQTQAGSGSSYQCYDRLNRLRRSAVQEFASAAYEFVDTEYDGLGRFSRRTEPYRVGAAGSTGETVVTLYDDVHRVRKMLEPNGAQTEYVYTGLTVTTKKSNAASTDPCVVIDVANCTLESSMVYGADGLVRMAIDALSNTTSTAYDAYGNVALITDPEGVETYFQYDLAGRNVLVDDPNFGLSTYDYSGADDLVRVNDQGVDGGPGNNRLKRYEYDEFGRIIAEYRESVSVPGNKVASWVYDGPDGALAAPFIGRLHTEGGDGTQAEVSGSDDLTRVYSYLDSGLLESIQTTISTPEASLVSKEAYGYYGVDSTGVTDAAKGGFLENVTYSDNVGGTLDVRQKIGFNYNTRGYRTSTVDLLDSNARLHQVKGVNARGQITKHEFGPTNGAVVQEFIYDPFDARAHTVCAYTSGSSCITADIQEIQYKHNPFSQVREVDNVKQNHKVVINQVDALGRLRQQTRTEDGLAQSAENFTYNKVGQLLTKGQNGSYTYGDTDHPYFVKSIANYNGGGVATFTPDNWGNQQSASGAVNRSNITYSWDNKPLSITSSGVTTNFRYGPNQSRFQQHKVESGLEKTRLYMGSTEYEIQKYPSIASIARVVAETQVGGVLTRRQSDNDMDGEYDTPYADTDGDGFLDKDDLCRGISNTNEPATLIDTDSDGIGNRCDADFNNDLVVNFFDVDEFADNFNSTSAEHDLNGDGLVNFSDYIILISYAQQTARPGPGKADDVQDQYILSDELGSVETIVDETGGVLGRFHYDAFGHRGPVESSIENDYTNAGYTGHEQLDDVGLVHMGGRAYDPIAGQFLSVDPVIPDVYNSQSYGSYSYVFGSPFDLTDPSGYNPNGSTGAQTGGGVQTWVNFHTFLGTNRHIKAVVPVGTRVGTGGQTIDLNGSGTISGTNKEIDMSSVIPRNLIAGGNGNGVRPPRNGNGNGNPRPGIQSIQSQYEYTFRDISGLSLIARIREIYPNFSYQPSNVNRPKNGGPRFSSQDISALNQILRNVQRGDAPSGGPLINSVSGPLGRPESIATTVSRRHLNKGTPTNSSSREYARRIGRATDDAGHLLGRLLGGPGGYRSGNIFPQNSFINRGAYRDFELFVRSLIQRNGSASIRIQLNYANGATTRPSSVTYQVTTGGRNITREFLNP